MDGRARGTHRWAGEGCTEAEEESESEGGEEDSTDWDSGDEGPERGRRTCGSRGVEEARGHRGGVTCLVAGRMGDGRVKLLSGARDGSVRAWEVDLCLTQSVLLFLCPAH